MKREILQEAHPQGPASLHGFPFVLLRLSAPLVCPHLALPAPLLTGERSGRKGGDTDHRDQGSSSGMGTEVARRREPLFSQVGPQ